MNKLITVTILLLVTSVAHAQTYQSFYGIGQPTGTANSYPSTGDSNGGYTKEQMNRAFGVSR